MHSFDAREETNTMLIMQKKNGNSKEKQQDMHGTNKNKFVYNDNEAKNKKPVSCHFS